MKKPAPAPIHSLLAERWSPRAFTPRPPLSEEDLAALAEAARWTPSCFGAEPWHFVFCDRGSDARAWETALGCLAPGNQAWAKESALLILACGRKDFARDGRPNRHFAYDTGAAAFALVLQAEALGLRCHQMAGFDAQAARRAFAVPEECECLSFIAVGRQAEAGTLPDELRAREESARRRKPPDENFFRGGWGKGWREEKGG